MDGLIFFSLSLRKLVSSSSTFLRDWRVFPRFLLFTDYCIYWIHRLEHHPSIYKHIHKPHHKWISEFRSFFRETWVNLLPLVPTPWAAYAFHPLDGYIQSVPYHLFVFVCPLQRHLYLGLFVCINIWTVFVCRFARSFRLLSNFTPRFMIQIWSPEIG